MLAITFSHHELPHDVNRATLGFLRDWAKDMTCELKLIHVVGPAHNQNQYQSDQRPSNIGLSRKLGKRFVLLLSLGCLARTVADHLR